MRSAFYFKNVEEYIKVQSQKLQIPQSPTTWKEPASTDAMMETENIAIYIA